MGLNEALKLNPPVPAGNAMAQCAVADLTKQDAANMPPDDFLGQYFRGIRNTGPDQWVALCPAHGDKNPSLSITRGEDKYLFCCHAGCAYEEIVEKAGALQSSSFLTLTASINKTAPEQARLIVSQRCAGMIRRFIVGCAASWSM